MEKINPFKPNSPTRPGMLVGRYDEIKKIDSALIQTRNDRTQSFLLLGERGIGKTSLLNLVKFIAEGQILFDDSREHKHNFLVIETDITKDTTQIALIKKIELALQRKLAKTEKSRAIFKEIWNFISKIEAAGIKLNSEKDIDKEIFFEEFSYSLSDTLNRLTKKDENNNFDASYDGIIIIIDEADNAMPNLQLGSFVKLLVERLQKEGTEKLMFGISGLPKTREILIESHPSSIRLFEELNLDRLKPDDVKLVIEKVLEESKKLNKVETTIENSARDLLITFSEGFPHFIHQYGFSAYETSNGLTITDSDVQNGAFHKNGALECIGKKYYHDDFYNKIKSDGYRQVLVIMSEHLDGWVTKAQIKAKFKGGDSILKNAINALVTRNIIVPKDGERGAYRLQDKGFAWWIAMNKKKEALTE